MNKTELKFYIVLCITFFVSMTIFSHNSFIELCYRHSFAFSVVLSFVFSILVLSFMLIWKYASELRKYHKKEE